MKKAGTTLARLSRIESLSDAYEAWRELKLEHSEFLSGNSAQRQKLQRQGNFLLGAVRAAGTSAASPTVVSGQTLSSDPTASGADALATRGELQKFLSAAEQKMASAEKALGEDVASEAVEFERAFEVVKAEIRGRLERYAHSAPPRLKLMLRQVDSTRMILHLARPGADEALVLLFILTGAIPTRYGFAFDDATDDLLLEPPALYADEGVDSTGLRPDPVSLRAAVENRPVVPVKGFIPVFVPGENGPEFFRLLQRGPVMEVERADGGRFRNILSREEGERFAGYLLRLKLEGRLALELESD